MDYSPIISEVSKLWWLVPVFIFFSALKTPWFKGLLGEALVKLSARVLLPQSTYRRFHNVTLPTPDGSTQIDHIFLSPFGVFVVETKNMKGWIFCSERQSQWTQKIYRKTYKFQNPLRQNFKHIKALESILDIPADAIYSVVVFTGNSTFKSPMPANVTTLSGYIGYIKSFSNVVLSEEQIAHMAQQIESQRLSPSLSTNREHVKRLQTRSDPTAERKCPKCGSPLILRTSKRGANAGQQFWGCSSYPKCRVVQNIP